MGGKTGKRIPGIQAPQTSPRIKCLPLKNPVFIDRVFKIVGF